MENYYNKHQKKKGGGELNFIIVFILLCTVGFNTSCSSDLDKSKNPITENIASEYEIEDPVLGYIKTISSMKYKLTYIDSVVNKKKISNDSAYMDYLYFKYSYLTKHFYNNEKYDAIDLPLYFTEHEHPKSKNIIIDDVIVHRDITALANKYINIIQTSVLHCPIYIYIYGRAMSKKNEGLRL